MITIICSTNRTGSYSIRMAGLVAAELQKREVKCQILSMKDLPDDFPARKIDGNSYPEFDKLTDKFIRDVDKFMFIIPEYNGSFPGIVKTFIDSMHPKNFYDKKTSLIGISSGRSGALRALDDMTGILHYLRVEVMSDKPKFSNIENLLLENDELADEESKARLSRHIDRFMRF
jgi:chromate reductase, NAD(P)H dehydrogenase (quinone)